MIPDFIPPKMWEMHLYCSSRESPEILKVDELESDIAILTERIKMVREGVSDIEDMEELKRFTEEVELEEGLKHIELF